MHWKDEAEGWVSASAYRFINNQSESQQHLHILHWLGTLDPSPATRNSSGEFEWDAEAKRSAPLLFGVSRA
jgi:hypothetical protein